MIPRGLVILGLATLAWVPVIAVGKVAIETIHAPQATEAWMQAHRDDYFPTNANRCHGSVCDLTGPGGHLIVWDMWFELAALRGYTFRVVGDCVSA